MPNFAEWTASEVIVQMPDARNVIAKHLGREAVSTGSGARLRELAKWKNADLGGLTRDLNALVKHPAPR